jgi:hypothetical protein
MDKAEPYPTGAEGCIVGFVGIKRSRADDEAIPDAYVSKISVGGGAAGLIFTLGMVVILLVGLPPTRWYLAASVPLGMVVALILGWTARVR